MLRKSLMAVFLLSASSSVPAIDEFLSRHGVRVQPHVSITLGGGHHREIYRETRHHDHDVYYSEPRHPVYVPRAVHVQPIYYNNHYYRGEGKRHHNRGHYGWHNRDDHRSASRGHGRHHDRHHDDDDDDDD